MIKTILEEEAIFSNMFPRVAGQLECWLWGFVCVRLVFEVYRGEKGP